MCVIELHLLDSYLYRVFSGACHTQVSCIKRSHNGSLPALELKPLYTEEFEFYQ